MASRVLAPVLMFAAAALAAAPAFATEIPNWPCKASYEPLAAADVWDGPPPAAGGDWHDDAAVRELVLFTTNPENSPKRGRTAIRDYLASLDGDKANGVGLALAGMVQETNILRESLIAGVRDFYVRKEILGKAVKEEDAMLAELPEDATKERKEVQVARHANFRNMDDAEEEMDFMCYRLGYVDKKLRLLTQELQNGL